MSNVSNEENYKLNEEEFLKYWRKMFKLNLKISVEEFSLVQSGKDVLIKYL